MYRGKMTDELWELYEEYKAKFGYSPGGELSVVYNEATYDEYVRDIKDCIRTGIGITQMRVINYRKSRK